MWSFIVSVWEWCGWLTATSMTLSLFMVVVFLAFVVVLVVGYCVWDFFVGVLGKIKMTIFGSRK